MFDVHSFRLAARDKMIIGCALALIIFRHNERPPVWTRSLNWEHRGWYDPALFETFTSLQQRFFSAPRSRSRLQLSCLDLAACAFAVRNYRRQMMRSKDRKCRFSLRDFTLVLERLEVLYKRARRRDPAPLPLQWQPLLTWIRAELFAWRPPRYRSIYLENVDRVAVEKAEELAIQELNRRGIAIVDRKLIHREVLYKLRLLARRGWQRSWFVQKPDAAVTLADFIVWRNQGIKKPKEYWEVLLDAHQKLRATTPNLSR